MPLSEVGNDKVLRSFNNTVTVLFRLRYQPGKKLTSHKLPPLAQVSAVRDIAVDDFNADGFKDLLIVGNADEISTQLGRLDALHGLILLNNQKGLFYWAEQPQLNISGPARHIQKIRRGDNDYYIISINDSNPVFLVKKNE